MTSATDDHHGRTTIFTTITSRAGRSAWAGQLIGPTDPRGTRIIGALTSRSD